VRSQLVVATLSLIVVGVLSVALTLQSSTSHYDAAVKGQLLISGGLAPGTPRPSDGEVIAKNASGQSYSVSVPSTGKFTLQLPAGKYSLTGSSPQFGNGQYRCFALRTVTVFRGKAIHVDVYCQEK
jgi:hypothetical protein